MSSYIHCQPADQARMLEILCQAFGTSEAMCRQWLKRGGGEGWRGFKNDKGQLLGTLVKIPMAQWFEGRTVPMTGVAGVAVAVEARGRGVGKKLVGSLLQELHDGGVPLSVLYGSSTAFYRGLGYERAGSQFTAKVQVKNLNYGSSNSELRPVSSERDIQALEALYNRTVRWHGSLVRSLYIWERTRSLMGDEAQGFAIFSDDKLEGYFYTIDKSESFDDRKLVVTDLLLTTPTASQAFLSFLASQRALFATAEWSDRPNSPLLLCLPDRWTYSLNLEEHWLLRIVRVKDALEARGYPKGVEGRLHLNINDTQIPSNSGSWCLEVADGRGQVKPGGQAQLTMDVGGLAALYSGFMEPADLVLAGALTGDPDSLRLAQQLFSKQPCMLDVF